MNAKYVEDNNDITADRMYYKERKGKDPQIYESEEIIDTFENNKDLNKTTSKNSKDKTDIKKPKEYEDRILYCKVCGKKFIFSKGNQEKYDKNGWYEPNRCEKCERKKHLPTWINI